MKLVVNTFVTLDGVMQSPGAPQEDTSGGFEYGGWLPAYFSPDLGPLIAGWFGAADAFLLGRRTYQTFAGYWPHATDPQDVVAEALNNRPKYVASRSLTEVTWKGSALLRGDVGQAVAALKAAPGRELQVHGSAGLVQTLLAEDLVDEFRLFWFPVILGGTGKRLFAQGTVPTALKLLDAKTCAGGVVIHTYARAGKPHFGSVHGPDGR